MRRPIRVLELRSVRGTGGGPEKTILLGTARSDTTRYRITVCYLRDRRDTAFALDHIARQLDLDYVEVLERHSFDRAVWPALRALVRERGIDLVHAHDYKTNLLALLLARAEGIAPLSTAHGWTGRSARERWLYYPADRWLLGRFPRVVAVSGEIRARLTQAGVRDERIRVVPNGIDASRFRRDHATGARSRAAFGLPAGTAIIGGVGRLESQKRFDLLIDAVGRLRADGRDVTLAIVGAGSLEATLARHAARRGLDGRMLLLGQRADVADVLQTFDVFVQASDYEGTPNSVLEAMAMETPVVATDVGGTRELAADGAEALLVPPGRTDLLAAAIARTLDDRVATEARVRAARRRVETVLSFETRMRAVEDVYDELAGGRVADEPSRAASA